MGSGTLLASNSYSMAKQNQLLMEDLMEHTLTEHYSKVLSKSQPSSVHMNLHLQMVNAEILHSSAKMGNKLKDIKMQMVTSVIQPWQSILNSSHHHLQAEK